MNQSVLPEYLEQETIGRMVPGDTGYTLPWAMFADSERRLWINGDYPVAYAPHGAMSMAIQRTKEGVVVQANTIGDYRFEASHSSWCESGVGLPVHLE